MLQDHQACATAPRAPTTQQHNVRPHITKYKDKGQEHACTPAASCLRTMVRDGAAPIAVSVVVVLVDLVSQLVRRPTTNTDPALSHSNHNETIIVAISDTRHQPHAAITQRHRHQPPADITHSQSIQASPPIRCEPLWREKDAKLVSPHSRKSPIAEVVCLTTHI